MKPKAMVALSKDTTRSVGEICRIVGICRNTYYKYLRYSAGTASG